jgi:guanosine-3',5'-bis(diphosphate) 3'-pyrophosphohydrolase
LHNERKITLLCFVLRPYQTLRRKLSYLSREQVKKIHDAYLLAAEAHRGQKRQTGESYISHPVAVAMILADMRLDAESIIAALLHDVLEDTAVEKQELIDQFGESVADLVDGVTKLDQIFENRQQAQAEYFRKMVLAMSDDIRVILIKLADRLHNLRTIAICSYEKRKRVTQETLGIFAPIAYRLGMHALSQELKDLGFQAWHPKRYKTLQEAVSKARGNRKEIMGLITKSLKEGLSKSGLRSYQISGREKTIYAIYQKMQKKNASFSDIMDIYGFRLLVSTPEDCYRALGVVHSIYRPQTNRFKDYIAVPKANGYQSLHTSLFGAYGVPIEIQIRTFQMEELATSGIAAHWLYKTNESVRDVSQIRVQQWLKKLLEMQHSSGSSLEFIEHVKVDLFPDEVYVFTPKGRILELPAGSTVIDFAYAVHTDIGNHCVAAKINRKLVPVASRLKNSQTVEIITDKESNPNPMWLNFVVTGKAKSAIRHSLKQINKSSSIKTGKLMLSKAAFSFGVSLKSVSEEAWQKVLAETQSQDADALYFSIGIGHRNPNIVANQIATVVGTDSLSEDKAHVLGSSAHDHLLIRGTEGSAIKFATCCYPVPGDSIAGLICSGRGIEVHRQECMVLHQQQNQRVIMVDWDSAVSGEFSVLVDAMMQDVRGALANLTSRIASLEAGINDMKFSRHDEKHIGCVISLSVQNKKQLDRVLRSLSHCSSVVSIKRKMAEGGQANNDH